MKVSAASVAEKAAKRWLLDAHEQENRATATRASEKRKRDKEKRGDEDNANFVERSGGAGGTAAPAQIRCLRRRFAAWDPAAPAGILLKWWRTPVQRALYTYIYVYERREPMRENEK